ncbi:DUF3953 domain-containing protein [Paenibacillus yanchengensis]|uniref:DUF3953 domain-containing protein n=1 Tax=Paenibacillus yanchengensis TaxID=2035833 RepID=A0ABW4YEX6_9BACL
MKIIRNILAIIVMALASYSLFTDTARTITPYMLLALAFMLTATGMIEFKKQKANTWSLLITAIFVFIVAIYIM